jgi:hypothetical protein
MSLIAWLEQDLTEFDSSLLLVLDKSIDLVDCLPSPEEMQGFFSLICSIEESDKSSKVSRF